VVQDGALVGGDGAYRSRSPLSADGLVEQGEADCKAAENTVVGSQLQRRRRHVVDDAFQLRH
jgi:hypothetical protein